MALAAPCFGEDVFRGQDAELYPHAREPDALPAALRAGGDVVIAGEVAPAHPRAVVDHRERRQGRVGPEMQRARARIEGVGHDLGHDRLLEGAGIGVRDVFQKVLQIDACLAQGFCR